MTPLWSDRSGPEDGPFVALVHGSMDRSSGMLKLARVLDARCHVLRYDRRGYGRSVPAHHAPHEGPFGMDAQVADLVGLLDERPAVIVGHSYGGNVALALADRHPELVTAVSIYETPLSWEPWWPGTTAGAQATATAGDPAEAGERFMRRMIGDERWESLPERTRETRRREGAPMVGELTDLRQHRPWDAARIRVQLLAGYGSRGAPHHRQGMEHVVAAVEGARLVELADCRHDAPLSHPALFAHRMVEPLLDG